MRPEPFRPGVYPLSGIKDVQCVDEPVSVAAQLVEVEASALQVSQPFDDQLAGTRAEWNRRIGVMTPVVLRRVVGSDGVPVTQMAIGHFEKIIVHRTIIAEGGVTNLIAEVIDLLLRDRA